MNMKKFFSLEWDAIAGIAAAVVATVLNLLQLLPEQVVFPIVLGLLTLLFINFIRHARNNELTAEQVDRTARAVRRIQSELKPADVHLIGPRQLRSAHDDFMHHMGGDTIWFNVCLSMYRTQPQFDALLRPAIENPRITSLHFILDESQRGLWQQDIAPRIAGCAGGAKVLEPCWTELSQTTSFILADGQISGQPEALLSFWGEPFMARTSGQGIPRFVFRLQAHSELLPHLAELARSCSIAARSR
ncbi:MAG TPA: hypothetical protein PKH69_03170 [Thiobacillaceae bacterium]|nr:hypothetical protein [Thiobacillaceae bacterium]HNU63089.1 hypothetical protein [Thiobacillaceae bacterium]